MPTDRTHSCFKCCFDLFHSTSQPNKRRSVAFGIGGQQRLSAICITALAGGAKATKGILISNFLFHRRDSKVSNLDVELLTFARRTVKRGLSMGMGQFTVGVELMSVKRAPKKGRNDCLAFVIKLQRLLSENGLVRSLVARVRRMNSLEWPIKEFFSIAFVLMPYFIISFLFFCLFLRQFSYSFVSASPRRRNYLLN